MLTSKQSRMRRSVFGFCSPLQEEPLPGRLPQHGIVKQPFLLLLLACSMASASTLTMRLNVFDDLGPGRVAILLVSDGTNSLRKEFFHGGGEDFITQLGYCAASNNSSCSFTPGGNLTATDETLFFGNRLNSLTLGGVPVSVSDWVNYSITYSMNFTGGSPMSVNAWGPVPLNADLNIAIVQRSTGICVFCAHAPNGIGTARGTDINTHPFPIYEFTYEASGEIVPEPGSAELALVGIAALLATRPAAQRLHHFRRAMRRRTLGRAPI